MTHEIEVLEYTLPDYLACYLINGDASSLTDTEQAEIDIFLESQCVTIVDIKDDSAFRWRNDLNSLGASCSTYIAHKIK